MSFLSAIAGTLNPVSIIETVKDENLKRRLETLGVGLLWSQYITFLYVAGNTIQGKFIVGLLSSTLCSMAASAYVMLTDETVEKVILLSVPKALIEDKALLDSIRYASRGEKGTK